MENGLKGTQVEHIVTVTKCLNEQYVSLAFSEGLAFVMERVLFLCSGGLVSI